MRWLLALLRCLLPRRHRSDQLVRVDRAPAHDSRDSLRFFRDRNSNHGARR
jgi:hypothetical protein